MNYLLCYAYYDTETLKFEEEKFDDFEKAVSRYTLMCAESVSVVLVDLYNCEIIRQFARSGDGVCIY